MRTIDPAILLAAMATLETPQLSPLAPWTPLPQRRREPRDCKRREPVTFYRA